MRNAIHLTARFSRRRQPLFSPEAYVPDILITKAASDGRYCEDDDENKRRKTTHPPLLRTAAVVVVDVGLISLVPNIVTQTNSYGHRIEVAPPVRPF